MHSAKFLDGHSRTEWENLVARVDATLKKQGVPIPHRIAVVAQAAPEPPEDLGKLSTPELWQRHATIEDSAARTAFFRAHIKPRLTL